MVLLPSGLVVPPVWVLVVLGGAAAAEIALLYALRPPVTDAQVVAFAPWMLAGGVFHVLYQVGAVPVSLAPLFAAPAVYATTFVLLGFAWVGSAVLRGADDPAQTARDVGAAGAVVFLGLAGVAYWQALGLTESVVPLVWPVVGFVGTLAVFAPLYYLLTLWRPTTVSTVGAAGGVAVFAHLLDGVSTTIGVDLLGTTERTPLPRHVMEFAGTLPTAPFLGRGWLFVVVKFVVATLILVLVADYVEEEPDEGNLLLAFVTALGLGPAANNLFLFIMGGPVPG